MKNKPCVFVSDIARKLRGPTARVVSVLKAIYAPVENAELIFVKMTNLSTMLSQVI